MSAFRSFLSPTVATAALGVLLCGCDSFSGFVRPPSGRVEASAGDQAIRLQPGDKTKIAVYGEDKLTGDFDVDASGNIVMPLVGSVHVTGMTKQELEMTLKSRLRGGQILLAPQVSVDVASKRPFYVLGEVEKPGEYPLRSGLDVFSAVAVAGGFTYRASKSKIQVRRAGEKTFTEYTLSPDIPIYAGDLINVPERYF